LNLLTSWAQREHAIARISEVLNCTLDCAREWLDANDAEVLCAQAFSECAEGADIIRRRYH
jgi:hypothetical protein